MAQQNGSGHPKRAMYVDSPSPEKIGIIDLSRTDSAPEPIRLAVNNTLPEEANHIEELPILKIMMSLSFQWLPIYPT